MLSHDCVNCKFGNTEKRKCEIRFITVRKGEKVYCPDGSQHIVTINEEWITNNIRRY